MGTEFEIQMEVGQTVQVFTQSSVQDELFERDQQRFQLAELETLRGRNMTSWLPN